MVGDILQPTHLLFVLVIALLVLGPKRLPEVGRAIGDGLRDFRSAINGEGHSHRDELDHESGPEESEDGPKHEFAAESMPQAHDHDFAPDIPAPAGDHEFAHQEPAANGHEHQEPAANGHELAGGDPATADAASKVRDERAGDKHEFAYESSDPAPARDQKPN